MNADLTNCDAPFQALFYSSGIGISLVDLNRRIIDVNPAFEKLFGYQRGELKGQTFAHLLYPEDSALNLELHRQLLAGERTVYHMDRRYIRKDGEILWTRLMVSLLRDRQGKPELTMGVVEDITEQKRIEAKLHEQQELMARASQMATLGEVASCISHEVSSPLTMINFRAEQLRAIAQTGFAPDPITKKIEENVSNIEKNVSRINAIVKGLRALAWKREEDPCELVSISALISEAIELARSRLRYKGVDINIDQSAQKDLQVECRPTQILQVLVNLINNAVDAVSDLPDKWVTVEVHDIGHGIEAWVTDSGRGIPKEISNKIFQQFYTTKAAGQGMGLGLSISKTIMETHRGMLKYDPSYPHTRFLIGLPKRQSYSYFEKLSV